MKLLSPPAATPAVSATCRLPCLRRIAARPITDRVKESLFDVLYKYDLPNGKVVADLFSGVGSLGLEALSRGASFVTFVEKDPKVIAVLNRNIGKAGFVEESKVIRANAFKLGAPAPLEVSRRLLTGPERYRVDERKYDLIFVDPPYSTTRDVVGGSPLDGLLNVLSEQSAPDGIVIVRTNRRAELLEQYGRFGIIERRQWGTMAVTILGQISK